ncbi:hypothetical protein HDU67_003620 [Dinochytrium kinnereticum]|nr:hypothetical protein HDU67_003620 [Dinochytrium kinnereticum]
MLQAYKKFIVNIRKQAQAEKEAKPKLVEPGFCVKYAARSSKLDKPVFINVVKSKRIAAPPENDPLNIPMCLSTVREHITADGKSARVVDCVVNSAIIERCQSDSLFKADLTALAVYSVREQELKSLPSTYDEVLENHYEGPVGWDAYGRPIHSNINPPSEHPIQEAIAAAKEPNLHWSTDQWTEAVETLRLPGGSIVGDDSVPAQKNTLIQELDADFPIALESITHEEKINKATDSRSIDTVVPQYTVERSGLGILYSIHLPDVVSGKCIDVSVADGQVRVKSGRYSLYLEHPQGVSQDDCVLKFVKSNRTLKLRFNFK